MNKKPYAVLWDMDGTIIDTESAWITAEKELLRRFNSEIRDRDLKDWVGIGLWDLAKIMQARGVKLPADNIVFELSGMVDEIIFSSELPWRPGAIELIEEFASIGIPNALVTMATRAQALKVISRLPNCSFETITAGDDVAKPKPHPLPYVLGATSLAASPEDCVAIEDSSTGIKSAVSAGCFVVGVKHLVDISSAGSHLLLDTLSDVSAAEIMNFFAQNKHIEE